MKTTQGFTWHTPRQQEFRMRTRVAAAGTTLKGASQAHPDTSSQRRPVFTTAQILGHYTTCGGVCPQKTACSRFLHRQAQEFVSSGKDSHGVGERLIANGKGKIPL